MARVQRVAATASWAGYRNIFLTAPSSTFTSLQNLRLARSWFAIALTSSAALSGHRRRTRFGEALHRAEGDCASEHALDPSLMTAAERLAEIGEILALGILRLRAKHNQAGDRRDLSLDFPANQSVHVRKEQTREMP